jgi:hypothetical protein
MKTSLSPKLAKKSIKWAKIIEKWLWKGHFASIFFIKTSKMAKVRIADPSFGHKVDFNRGGRS